MDKALPSQKFLRSKSSKYFRQAGERRALELFRAASKRVPAYVKFLRENGVDAKHVKTIEDFRQLPVIDKDNYLTRYPLNELCWDGTLAGTANSISVSSGSTGEPFFWPLNDEAERIGQWYLELILRDLFQADKRSTLAVVSYTMGLWLAGTHMTKLFNKVSEAGYPLCVISPGINKPEALRAIQRLSPEFDQTIIIGYPPFVKDLIDEGEIRGINWKKINLRMIYGGEGFNETWRDYVLSKVGEEDFLTAATNKYAASDAGILGIETPASITLRRLCQEDRGLSHQLFGNERVPSVQQFNPALRYIEKGEEYLTVTTTNAVPLIRYNIKDDGGVVEFDEVERMIDGASLMERLDDMDVPVSRLPFVYIFGRAHNTATIYAVNVFPENVRAALEDKRIRHLLSGKFKMATNYTKKMDQDLHIILELAIGKEENRTLHKLVQGIFIEKIRELNSEYNRLIDAVGERAYPSLAFVPYGDPVFAPGAKLSKVESKK